MRNTRALVVAALTAAALASTLPAQAGGPLAVFQTGRPYLWPGGGANIPFNPDLGGLGPLDNAGAVAQTTAAFQAWADVASATATYVNAGALPIDVDETNFVPFFAAAAPDGLSAIVYDEDGAIFTLLFGADSGVLGFAGPEWLDTTNGTIVEGLSFMNGGALLPPNPFPVAEMLSVQVHEFGHYGNLAHTVVNGQVAGFGDTSGPTPFNTFPLEPLANRIETLYPFLFINGGQATLHRDDIAIFSTLYPEPTFAATTASISGRILGPNRTTPLTGVNVIARNVASPYDDAVSAISSDFTNDFTEGAPLVGRYRLRGLTPGANYVVFVDQILAGGFSTPPRALPNVEELYNGADESSNPATDDPSAFTHVSAAAGATAANINVIFNRIPEGPLAVGDDGFVELFPPFRFKLCGHSFSSVFVNANGNLTFGNGDSDFTESIREHLAGPPRIAALWDDLNPDAGGTVAFEQDSDRFKVTWTDVPEFTNTGANTFSISLFAKDDDDDDDGHHHSSSRDDADDDGHHGDGDDGHGSSGNRFSLRYGDAGCHRRPGRDELRRTRHERVREGNRRPEERRPGQPPHRRARLDGGVRDLHRPRQRPRQLRDVLRGHQPLPGRPRAQRHLREGRARQAALHQRRPVRRDPSAGRGRGLLQVQGHRGRHPGRGDRSRQPGGHDDRAVRRRGHAAGPQRRWRRLRGGRPLTVRRDRARHRQLLRRRHHLAGLRLHGRGTGLRTLRAGHPLLPGHPPASRRRRDRKRAARLRLPVPGSRPHRARSSAATATSPSEYPGWTSSRRWAISWPAPRASRRSGTTSSRATGW